MVRRVLDAASGAGLLAPAAGADPQATIAALVANLAPATPTPTPNVATSSGLTEAERQQQIQQQQLQLQQQQQVLAAQQTASMSDAITGKERGPPQAATPDPKMAKH